MKNSQFKLGGYIRYGELNSKMNHIVCNSPSAYSFEADWAEFIKEFDLGQNRWLTVQFIHEYDNVLGNKEQKELEDDAADSKGVISCIGSTDIERQFQWEYTSNMFRDVQLEGPSRVKTKGRPKSKRLRAELDKSIKKLMQKRKRKSHSDVADLQTDNDYDGSIERGFKASNTWNASEDAGFISLLNLSIDSYLFVWLYIFFLWVISHT
ncbi:hypothetical protein Ahy_B06g081179 [Arachis hypogaea]|uniref:Protein FAR1-RELATED SEQUENCE n=1 Tax=Arachis hypogaea TaxID=3818 RepID=A0A444YKF1_ARAHY|nr:hypothetical protein Ahy_B06g081179 [Arachis hypogaea]